MCEVCDGKSLEEFVAGVVADIRSCGWSLVAVEDDQGRHVCTYTVGLTRLHGHPELLFTGNHVEVAQRVLSTIAADVCSGARLADGDTVGGPDGGSAPACLLMRVANPERLAMAQAVYRLPGFPPVPALQVVWADEGGRWPWEMCEHHRRGQVLYGTPRAPWAP